MKYSGRILSLSLLLSMAIFFIGCDKGDDNKASKQDQQIKKLVGTWEATQVTYEGVDQADYADFTIQFTGDAGDDELSFTTTNRPSGKNGPWPAGGSVSFGSPVDKVLLRADDLTIDYTVTGTTLQMSFEYDGDGYEGPARTDEIGGDWVFNLTKVDQ